MAFAFKLPDVGEGITEGEIVRWLVKPGDPVAADAPLVEVQTDKAVVELPSPRAGIIVECFGSEGDIIPVGTTLVTIQEEGEQAPAAPSSPPINTERTVRSPAPAPVTGRVQAAPATRRLARELSVDLAAVTGTGPRGRIVPQDVRQQAAALSERRTLPPSPTAAMASEERTPVRLAGLRRVMAEHMVQSVREIPHVTVVEKFNARELVALRERLKPSATAAGVRLTYLPLIAKGLAMTLTRHPQFNARWEDGTCYRYRSVHVGMATDTPDGLVVPVVRSAEQRSVLEIAAEMTRLATEGRERRGTPSELSGSTITITGGGPLAGLFATPIINYPEVAILGVYRIQEEAVVVDGRLEPCPMMYLSLTFDHRIADGAEASRFLTDLKGTLADPGAWVLSLR